MSNQPLPASWLPMESAPKDGRLVRLLVSFEENAIDDGDEPFATIGQNNFQNDQVDRWQFVGWNWTHDEFTDGLGTPLGWLPMLDEQSAAARDVLAERQRQITAEGWTPEHDDEHCCDEIAALACYYAMPPAARLWSAESTGYGDTLEEAILPEGWTVKHWDGSENGRRRELIKAGALILAEIERIDRQQSGSPVGLMSQAQKGGDQ
ncbi:hypothetical protein [Pseudomonas sp. AOB-7]|uniref:hypothetical protein n=1 Tax=Pseudomonas sp. AOB-7 TaxID=2482750 RepID=UPI001C499122|nr:hypothetical protein [Pseudomonas sp. AOB-7]